jgi:RNA polymerase sigma-70 factor (ECF subfamily)
VFGVGFDEISETIQRDPAACRQLASRARSHVRSARPRFEVSKEKGLEIAEAFFAASRSGDMGGLRSLLAADVSLYSDGGGKVHAGLKPIHGVDDMIKLHTSLMRFFAKDMSKVLRYGMINGLPGFVTIEPGGILQTTALAIGEDGIEAIYVMRNPDKLGHLGVAH